MKPKIEFRYSWIYDEKYRESKNIKEHMKKEGKAYPSYKKILNYIKNVEKLWTKEGDKILNEISRITKLKWKEDKIICYVIGCGRSFSDPLTVKLFEKIEDFRDILIHELIHQIQIQNETDRLNKWFNYLYKKYKKEPVTIRTHFLLDAVIYKVLGNLYGKERLKEVIKSDSKFEDYKRTWKIVKKEGPDKILNKYYKFIN